MFYKSEFYTYLLSKFLIVKGFLTIKNMDKIQEHNKFDHILTQFSTKLLYGFI